MKQSKEDQERAIEEIEFAKKEELHDLLLEEHVYSENSYRFLNRAAVFQDNPFHEGPFTYNEMEKKHRPIRLCRHSWNSNCGKPGSQHYCELEDGHVGPHECRGAEGDCNEVTKAVDEEAHIEIPFHLRMEEVMRQSQQRVAHRFDRTHDERNVRPKIE